MYSYIANNVSNTITTINNHIPFLVKCKTNNNKVHHLEHADGREFSLYAVIRNITSKLNTDNQLEGKSDDEDIPKNKLGESPRKRFFDIETDFYFKDTLYGIDIYERFTSLSSLARSMAIILDCIKNKQLGDLKELLDAIKKHQPTYESCPLKYFVDKGTEGIIEMFQNDTNNDDRGNKDRILSISNRKGLNGWSTILYQACDNNWYVLDSLFDKDIRGGINFISADEDDERLLLPRLYDIQDAIHFNSYHDLTVTPIYFDNKEYFNKKGVYLPPKKTSRNIKKRKRDEYIKHILETLPEDYLEDNAIEVLTFLKKSIKRKKSVNYHDNNENIPVHSFIPERIAQ